MKKIFLLLALFIAGCTDNEKPYDSGQVLFQQYMKEQNCRPQAFELKNYSYEFCGTRNCSNYSYPYYRITYKCYKNGDTLVLDTKNK